MLGGLWLLVCTLLGVRHECERCAEVERKLKFEREQNEARGFLLGVLDKVEGKKNGTADRNAN